MYLVALGLLLFLMKVLEIGPVADWSWLWVLAPFAGAMLWWWYADASGYNKRKEIEKIEARKVARREKNLVNMGMDPKRRR